MSRKPMVNKLNKYKNFKSVQLKFVRLVEIFEIIFDHDTWFNLTAHQGFLVIIKNYQRYLCRPYFFNN